MISWAVVLIVALVILTGAILVMGGKKPKGEPLQNPEEQSTEAIKRGKFENKQP